MKRFIEKFVSDRRLARRYVVKTSARVRVRQMNASEQVAELENVSKRGVFFETSLSLVKGSPLDISLEMPQSVTGMPAAYWLCTGHVVRVEHNAKGTRGVGVEFDCYEISPIDRLPSSPILDAIRKGHANTAPA